MLSIEDILDARDRVAQTARKTPLEYSPYYSQTTGANIHLKLETFQRTGSFKVRGATNRILTLSEAEREAGVVTASAGNHAQGVALAANRLGVDATIVMPKYAPLSKVKATRSYGGNVILHGMDYDSAAQRAHEIEEEESRTYVHAFDDPAVMAGQGTLGLEIIEDLPDVDTVVSAIGGGGLISGVATAIKAQTDARVIGVQAEGAASVPQSLEQGHVFERDSVDTIADGIATRRVGDQTFEIIQDTVDEVVTVSDSEIAVALTGLLEHSKVLTEGAGAAPLAAVLFDKFEYTEGEEIAVGLCGGNIDLNTVTTVIMRGLVETGRYVRIRTILKDRPGALDELIDVIANLEANIYAIQHDRTSRDIGMDAAWVELDLETKGHDHIEELLDGMSEAGYEVEVLV
ncbi:threonine ammonia-lyase [Salinarchaeum sp. IM2453]|uniref:threonine ammonia-lyase n=1 Tax=Salinarchaeum sp. IM2453 TaxID=2862870 RepID=UPI001C840734|nr:threonine ammonia-lyase [Salinarchaeum sp. IM2453]QZA89449.1 threonine ammonia-lyase [Salinarchaeum sp. IM2453]